MSRNMAENPIFQDGVGFLSIVLLIFWILHAIGLLGNLFILFSSAISMIKLDCVSTCSKNPNRTELILGEDGMLFAYRNSGTDKNYHFPRNSQYNPRTRVIGYVSREPASPEGSYSAPIIPENFSSEPRPGYSPIIIETPSAAHVENIRIVSIDRHFDPATLSSNTKTS